MKRRRRNPDNSADFDHESDNGTDFEPETDPTPDPETPDEPVSEEIPTPSLPDDPLVDSSLPEDSFEDKSEPVEEIISPLTEESERLSSDTPESEPNPQLESDPAESKLVSDEHPPSVHMSTPAPVEDLSLPSPLSSETDTPRSAVALEQRVRRLEEVLSLIQQGKPFSIPTPLKGNPATAQSVPGSAITVPTARIVADPPLAIPAPGPSTTHRSTPLGNRGPTWLFWEMVIELRVFWRIYTDPRYQLSWFGRLFPPALLIVFLFSGWFFMPLAILPIVGPWIDRLLLLVVAYVLFKCLSSEARRYRQTAPDLPASLRL